MEGGGDREGVSGKGEELVGKGGGKESGRGERKVEGQEGEVALIVLADSAAISLL